jgi:hypothetical protein
MYLEMRSPPAAIVLVMTLLAFNALGQESSQQSSLQSIRTPEAPLFQALPPNPAQMSFLRLGPFYGTAGVNAGYTFTDNANASQSDKLSQNEWFEGVDLALVWTLSPFNRIDLVLNGELQENFYSDGKQLLNVMLLPGSQIVLQAKLGDALLRAFEQFAITQDPTTDPAIAGQTNLNRFTNTVGMGVLLPLSRVYLGLGFDYTYSDILGSSNPTPQSSPTTQQGGVLRNSFRLGGTFGIQVSSALSYGLEVNATANTGSGPNDVYALSIGPFLRGRLTRLLEVDSGVGLLLISAPKISPTQYYAYLSVRSELSRIFWVLGGITHDFDFSTGLGVTENNNFHLTAQANLSRMWTVSVAPVVNFGRVINGQLPGSYTQYGVAVDSMFRFSTHLAAGIGYRFTKRDSGAAGAINGEVTTGRYTQNLVSFTVSYGF